MVYPDNETELFVWDIAESNVTMMAACIPTLRVLFRDVRDASSRVYEISDRREAFFITPKRWGGDRHELVSAKII